MYGFVFNEIEQFTVDRSYSPLFTVTSFEGLHSLHTNCRAHDKIIFKCCWCTFPQPKYLTSNKETIKKYRKILTPRNGNLTWARTECRNDPRSHITYAVMAGIVTGRFDLGEGYPKLEPIIPALLCNTDCAQLKITPASDGTIAVVTTEEVSTAKKIKPSGKGRRQSRC
jgi:hypothetical protein